MSFFSDINGFNAKAMKSINDNAEKKQTGINDEDYSEVDFCLGYEENANTVNSKNDNGLSLFEKHYETDLESFSEDSFDREYFDSENEF